jgi:hypothetical protein
MKISVNSLLNVYLRFGRSASTVTRQRVGRPGFDTRQGMGFFLLATASRPVLWPTQSPTQWVLDVSPTR